jgi:signal transduction histidine kinase/DNA-binding NarL/FixJ family response regulator
MTFPKNKNIIHIQYFTVTADVPELVKKQFFADNISISSQSAFTPDELFLQISQQVPDIIVLGLEKRLSNERLFVNQIHEYQPDIPIIIIKDTPIGNIADCINWGISDIVASGNIDHLSFSIIKTLVIKDLRSECVSSSAILNSSKSNICLLDEKGFVLLLNNSWHELKAKNCCTWNNVEIGDDYIAHCLNYTGENSENVQYFAQRILDIINNRSNFYEVEFKQQENGSYQWFKGSITPLFADNSESRKVIILYDNITLRKKAEADLIQAKEKAEESDRLKSAFLANLSHEIRTPMNGLIGFSEMLCNKDITDENKQMYIDIIRNSGKQLVAIITDIVDIARIETKQIFVWEKSTSVNQILKDAYSSNLSAAQSKNIELNIRLLPSNVNDEIISDETKLCQIINHILGNAIKFTNEGKVEFGCTLKNNNLQFFVKDTGVGIQPEHQNLIFETFRQVEDSYTRKYGGIGLGLSIAKAFIEVLGGKIWIESVYGKGSSFYFSIPYNNTEKENVNQLESIELNNFDHLHILIAEDEEVNFMFLEELLSNTGITITRAEDGQKAVNYCIEKEDINLVLMDIRMPVMDGITATQKIKSFRKDLPIVAVTAYALSGDKEKFINAGCDDYLPKPVKREELFLMISKYCKS